MDHLSNYQYDLPEEMIAQEPASRRDASRLLVLYRGATRILHRRFTDLTAHIRPGDVLVLNDTRVIPARLIGHRRTGGKVELLLLKEIGRSTWECLAKPARKLDKGEIIHLAKNRTATVLASREQGRRTIRFEPLEGLRAWLEFTGSPPLPPYIRRLPKPEDRKRYQTIYAAHNGAVAAPTAGLHFTGSMLKTIENRGIDIAHITLHVGIGTFQPVTTDNLDEHRMDPEWYEVKRDQAERINRARRAGGRVVAVGTTVVRTLETVADKNGVVHPGRGESGLFIRPPYRFKAVDALLTNFHLPGSTLIMLVSAFAGRRQVLSAYGEAITERYRFFSYGDAMLIV